MFRKCKWVKRQDTVDVIYITSCGHLWDITDQMITAYKYCPCCGRRITTAST